MPFRGLSEAERPHRNGDRDEIPPWRLPTVGELVRGEHDGQCGERAKEAQQRRQRVQARPLARQRRRFRYFGRD